MNDKLSKFLAVVCLTLLIWTWAFLSQEDEEPFSGTLEVSPAADRSLLASFWVDGKDMGQKVNLELTFKGTPAKITALSRQAEQATPDNPQKNPLNYYYNPRDFAHTQTQIYPFSLKDFLQKQSQTKGLALTLESCSVNQEPVTQIEVHIEVLEKKLLDIECLRETGLPIRDAITEPVQVEMYVQENYNRPAYVTLSARQIELAQQQRPIRVRPYVEMGTAEQRQAQEEVTVTLLKNTLSLLPRVFQPQPQNIGFVFSNNLQGKYIVQIDSESESKLRTIHLRATDEAYDAYKKMRYPILIEIRDEDVSNLTAEIPPKEIIYNFPPEYVTKQAIEPGDPQPPKTAVIKLIPVTATPASP
ncbi:MAG: hypothetical protein ISS71_07455 [Phycisphaerae bacterium]|nr:hypothetical protein [Phycisphaerae bacterium]